MRTHRVAVVTLAAAIVVIAHSLVGRGQQQTAQPLPPTLSAPAPMGAVGEQVFPAFEGWGPHKNGPSGTNYVLVGYFNRNKDQTIDVPIGPNNRIEPGGPDMLQPTHFESGREWGVFTLPVSKEMGTRKYTWTLVTNGKSTQVQFWVNPPYWVDFFKNAAKGNTPPVVKFASNGPEFVGPPIGVAQTLNAAVNQPLTLTMWVTDRGNTYDPEDSLPPDQRSARGRGGRGRANAAADPNAAATGAPDANAANGAAARGGGRGRGNAQNFDLTAAQTLGSGSQTRGGGGGGGFGRGGGPQPDVTVTWKVHRGSSPVKFADKVIRLFNQGDPEAVMEATTTATFSAPGEYMLRAQVNDDSGDGGGGEQCCWTNALVRVTVK